MYNPKHSSDPDFRFPRQCFFLKFNGFWPKSLTRDQPAVARGALYELLMLLYPLLSWLTILDVACAVYWEFRFLISVFDNLMLLTENMCSSFMGFLVLSRMVHMHMNQGKLRRIIGLFVKDIWIATGSAPCIERECRRKMRPYLIMAMLLSTLISIYCTMPFIQAIHLGLASQEKSFPYRMSFSFDAQRPVPYVCVFFIATYAGFIVVSTLIAEDTLIGFCITYTCGQYQILHERIDNLRRTSKARVKLHAANCNESRLQQEYLRELNDIAHKHNKLVEFVDVLEDTISLIILVNFAFSTALLCLVGFQLATGKNMVFADYLKFGIYICATLSQLYILCWNGDRLIQISALTADHLYACDWEGDFPDASKTHAPQSDLPASKRFRQHLQIMIMNSQRPAQVTAGKFAVISLQSFSRLLSSAMSYFTLLQTMYKSDS